MAVPLALVPASDDPLRGAARLAAADFADEGAALHGRPAAMARAAARLEYLAHTLTQDARYGAVPGGTVMALGSGVREVRQVLGIAESAVPEQLVGILTAAAQAIEAGRVPVLPAAIFPAGQERTLQRLNEPGPLPDAALATGRLVEVIDSLDARSGWGTQPATTPTLR
ncbi:hypothetical protein [Teichococcus oryzae]|uniref:Uncharacterized protein n=1 Tax=Teichococcus oryzae TaxID=1608942 RepID=A0A5B2TFI0_9PROT|nr:hypothetical protein [Pseudoroseomonas oryzae]KAA2212648.1 hypothetical protein F0Q34_13095 [Pseudoroseomonas oryzae]